MTNMVYVDLGDWDPEPKVKNATAECLNTTFMTIWNIEDFSNRLTEENLNKQR